MSSATSKILETAPTPPIFSYAQAAKGRTPSTAPSAVQSSQTTSGVSTPHKETAPPIYTPSIGSERGAGSVNGGHEITSRSDVQKDGSTSEAKVAASSASPHTGAATVNAPVKEDVDDDFTFVGRTPESSKDRHAQGSHSTEKTTEEKEGRKSKKGKKQKAAEKEPEKEKEEVKPEILIPAPIPTVNFWAQRKVEAAKVKPSPTITQVSNELSSDAKSADPKKRAKNAGNEDGEKQSATSTPGPAKDSPVSGKGQKKGGDSSTKASREEQANKRSTPRGSRALEKEDKSPVNQLPPPVEDAISWPTPETALEEEKRKAQEKVEREEKDNSSSTKQPRPKDKWVHVPHIPTVTFNTPLPPRGGRGRGGARGGRTEAGSRPGHAANGGEKATTISTTASSPSAEARSLKDAAVRTASLPPASNRQPDQAAPRNQRKTGTSNATPDKAKTEAGKNEVSNPAESRNSVANVRPEHTSGNNQDQVSTDDIKSLKQDQFQGGFDSQFPPNFHRPSDASLKGSESTYGKDNGQGRPDRGRGGFRGRGNGHNFQNGQHSFPNGQPPQPPNGFPGRQGASSYSPSVQQQPFSNQYAVTSRGGRNPQSGRSQSIPNGGGNMYPQYRPNGSIASQHMAPLQTSGPAYDFPMQPMSAGPYNPYIDSVSILHMVTMQLEYYFSIDNLCKDVFLRKHMDSQGFVFLSVIAGFKRIQSLTQDFELLRFACQESEIIELVKGGDGIDRLRRKEGWEKWVLAVEEREETARNAGPEHIFNPYLMSRGQHMQQMAPNHLATSPPPYSPNGAEQSFRPYANGSQVSHPTNGHSFHPETPLSAAVADFAPGMPPVNGSHDPLEAEVTFDDEEVANLTLVFNSPKGSEDPKPKVPFHNSSSRTFSNGSIDGRSIAEELHDEPRQGRTLANGGRISETSPEDLRRSRSPFAPLSPTRTFSGNGPPVMWVKGQRQQPVSEHNTQESYSSFRHRALGKRDHSVAGETHPDMKLLYEFWSHFLCRNFNLNMYNEFRQYAFEDAKDNALSGMQNLINYYDEVLNSKKKVIPEVLARHYVAIVKEEKQGDRPAFKKLRAAWRNGAVDMKSRKKIDNLVDPELRAELERHGHQKSSS